MTNYLNRSRYWLLIGLVVLNLVLLGIIVFGGRPGDSGRRPPDMSAMWQRELKLDDEQRAQFDRISEEHHRANKLLLEAEMENRKALLQAVASDNANIAALTAESANLHQQLDKGLIQYYQHLRTICTPEQQSKMTDIFIKTLRRAGPPPKE